MKTQKNVLSILLIGFAVLLTNCSNNVNSVPGSLTLKASSFASSQLSKAPSVLAPDVTITSAVVQIKDLVIEENTGEGLQSNNENNNSNDGSDGIEGLKGEDGGDLTLVGPYVLDVFSGSTLIDNVSLHKGTYKKVDFSFVPGTGNTHSISIGGNYNRNGITVPFTIITDFNSSIQLPLAGTGLTINSGTASSLSIVFNINLWVKNLDFTTAVVKDNVITISATENKALYDVFVNALSTNIDVEKE